MAYFIYDYGEPNVFGLVKLPLIGNPYTVVLQQPALEPGETTSLSDSYPAISLEAGGRLALTAECTYAAAAALPAVLHIYTSYDGKHWDTEEATDADGRPLFGAMPLTPGQTVRRTRDVTLCARFVKVTVENTDPDCGLHDVKVVATFA